MNFHVVMPFSRPENAQLLKDNLLQSAKLSDIHIVWHPIIHTAFPLILTAEEGHWLSLQPNHVEVPQGWDACYYKLNRALELLAPYNAEEFYHFICDDDWYSPYFIRTVLSYECPIVLNSLKRGHHIVPAKIQHTTNDVIASEAIIRKGWGGMAMLSIRGDMLKFLAFPNYRSADDAVCRGLLEHFPEQIAYADNAWVWFNYLEPGRWDNAPEEIKRRAK